MLGRLLLARVRQPLVGTGQAHATILKPGLGLFGWEIANLAVVELQETAGLGLKHADADHLLSVLRPLRPGDPVVGLWLRQADCLPRLPALSAWDQLYPAAGHMIVRHDL